MSDKCNCYACRNYFDACEERRHPKRIRARHYDGSFWWGKKPPSWVSGRWVKICVPCRDALVQYGND